jgi:hypothetical protein
MIGGEPGNAHSAKLGPDTEVRRCQSRKAHCHAGSRTEGPAPGRTGSHRDGHGESADGVTGIMIIICDSRTSSMPEWGSVTVAAPGPRNMI